MGCQVSLHDNRNKKRESTLAPNQQERLDNELINRLRIDLNERPEHFVLNNILLSIQFFENYEREIENLRKNQVSEREIKLNKVLTDYRKLCLLPDMVMDSINKRIRFRPFHGPKKFESEPLLPQRMFIIHDNIEILRPTEGDYSTVDRPIHRANIELANHKGYVKLRQVEFLDKNKEENEDCNANYDKIFVTPNHIVKCLSAPSSPQPLLTGDEKLKVLLQRAHSWKQEEPLNSMENLLLETRKTNLKNKIWKSESFNFGLGRQTNVISKEQLLSKSTENVNKIEPEAIIDEYGYTTLKRLTTPKQLNEARANRKINDLSSLSSFCITDVKTKKIPLFDDEDDDKDEFDENGKRKPPVKKKTEDFFEMKKYFNSMEFSAHFADIFEHIYSELGFSDTAFEEAMFQGGAIHCSERDQNNNKILYEIIPSVATAWPDINFEWALRSRPKILDPVTNMVYQWPTESMKHKITSQQSNILPIGFLAKRGLNEENSLEWSLAFPAAERYMETCMSHAQMRCYIFILALYKTFMEPEGTKLGLTPQHIRNLIFWECEKNYMTWPDNRLGSKMLKVLELLYKHLANGYLADYFVQGRNLMDSCPSKYLRISQEKLHKIIERPVMHVLLAMRNLRYTSGTFFPTLNFKKLYYIITVEDAFSLINPNLTTFIGNDNNNNNPDDDCDETGFKKNVTPFWQKVQKQSTNDRLLNWKRNLRKQMDAEKKMEDEHLKKLRRGSIDSVNLNYSVSHLDIYRKRVILEFFINHFLAVAHKCFDYKSYNYALFILNHTLLLAILLGEEPAGEIEAKGWKRKITQQIEKCKWEIQQKQEQTVNRGKESRRHINNSQQTEFRTNHIKSSVVVHQTQNEPIRNGHAHMIKDLAHEENDTLDDSTDF